MAKAARTPNTQLDALLTQAQWTRAQFVRALNRTAQQASLDVSYTQQAVSYWISGGTPKPEARPLILAVLADRLGRPITHTDAGLPAPTGSQSPDTVEELIDLGRADMDPSRRRAVLGAASIFTAALTVPAFADLSHATTGREPVAAGKATVRIGESQVASVIKMTDRIADILDEDGAGHARPLAGAYLVNTIGPWLRAQAADSVAKRMRAAAADFVYLSGWMAMYEHDHGEAQRRYLTALSLAGEAQDHVTYCRVLRGMSLQHTSLGYGQKALTLADSAAEAAPASGPRLLAFLRGQQAHAASMTGDKHQAHTRLREAEDALSRADSRRDAIGGYDRTAWLFHLSHVLYEERDLPGSVKAMKDSLRHHPTQERQGRVHSYAILAQRQLEHGHLDAACDSWGRFLDEYEHVSSARGDAHLATMRTRLRPYAKARPVKQLTERAREVAALKA